MSRMNWLGLALGTVAAITAPAALAQTSDPAGGTVQTLHNGLLSIMHAGASAGQQGRARQIGPVIDRTFDIPQMTRLAVGPSWNNIAPADQSALVTAFRSLTVAQYAKNFDGFSGERFTMAPQVETRGGDKLVRTTLVVPNGSPESLGYRLRQSGGQWKIIDVYYRNSISQLATRRADFARVLASGGAKALIAHLGELAAKPH
ncbi:ABC transporter substrate-binding protein [Novosphingobium sp. G106]|uniref:ABC transporter substrate-binding protein n=1 Tax=Novosphingobium sp. G106 TaxID=2849500 RepID=UPI0020C2E9F9|nr:ABC transporter substrate-binding protein [Novosphingobium sp. G106]